MSDKGRFGFEQANSIFSKWATGFSGCDGGDIGSSQCKSIWFCGIEWGGGHPPEEAELTNSILSENVELPAKGYSDWKDNISYIFNWQAMKLLAAINGRDVSEYKEFAESVQPFVEGKIGYFKMNLYPLAFKNTSHELWKDGFAKATGLNSKQDYLGWIKYNRFPLMNTWVETYSPKLIVCVGKSYLDEYAFAFANEELAFQREVIDDRELNWTVGKNGTILVVVPFMVNRNGLTQNVSIQKFGDRIRELLLSL